MRILTALFILAVAVISVPDLLANSWVQESGEGHGLFEWSPRALHATVVFQDRLWIIGGNAKPDGNQAAPTREVWSSADGLSWLPETLEAPWQARRGHTSAVFDPDGNGERLWVIGGLGPGGGASSLLRDVWSSYDGIEWTQELVNAPWDARQGHATVVFDGKLWVMGGQAGVTPQNRKDVWSSENGVDWTPVTDNPGWAGRYGHGAVVFDNRMWILGGTWGPGAFFNDVWYSEDGETWENATDDAPWLGRDSHGATVFDGRLWIAGGRRGGAAPDGIMRDVWSSADGENWQEAANPAPWDARYGHSLVSFQDRLWVMSGMSFSSAFQKDVWSSADGADWTVATSWNMREEHAAVVFNDRMWVMGGIFGNGIIEYNDVWSSPDGVHWTLETAHADWAPRGGHTVTVFDGKLWLIGGHKGTFGFGTTIFQDIWSSTDGVNWTQEPGSAGQRTRHAALAFNGRLWVMGGAGAGGDWSDVWSSADGVTWTVDTFQANWSERYGHTAFIFNDRMWVMGGYGGNPVPESMADVWSSADGVQWTLEQGAPGWVGRRLHAAAVYDGRVWVMGGRLDGQNFSNDVWSSINGRDWVQENDGDWSPRRGHAALAFDDRLWVLSGTDAGNFASRRGEVWSYMEVSAPVIGQPPLVAIAGETYTWRVVSSGLPSPEVQAVGLPGWLELEGDTLTGTPLEGDIGETGTITVTAVNSEGADSLQFLIDVQGAPARIMGDPVTVAIPGTHYSYDMDIQGIPAPVVTIENLPGWLAFDPLANVLHGDVPAGARGGGHISITADNGWGEPAVQVFAITVQSPFGEVRRGGGCALGPGSGQKGGNGAGLALLAGLLLLSAGRVRRLVDRRRGGG